MYYSFLIMHNEIRPRKPQQIQLTYPHSDPTLIVTRHPTSSRTIYNYACATNLYDN